MTQLKSNFKFELVDGWMFGLFRIQHSGWSVALTMKVSNKVQDITYSHLNPIYYIIYYCGAVIGPVIGMKYYGKPPTCYTKKVATVFFFLFLINFLFLAGCYGSCLLAGLGCSRKTRPHYKQFCQFYNTIFVTKNGNILTIFGHN